MGLPWVMRPEYSGHRELGDSDPCHRLRLSAPLLSGDIDGERFNIQAKINRHRRGKAPPELRIEQARACEFKLWPEAGSRELEPGANCCRVASAVEEYFGATVPNLELATRIQPVMANAAAPPAFDFYCAGAGERRLTGPAPPTTRAWW